METMGSKQATSTLVGFFLMGGTMNSVDAANTAVIRSRCS
jgi:hypothetical protein